MKGQFERWQALPDSYISFRFTGTCFSDPRDQNDGANTVGWGLIGGSAGGITLPGGAQETPYNTIDFGTTFKEVDIIVDNRILDGLNVEAALKNILPVIVLHEIGHFVGLAHSPRGCAVMAPSSLQTEFCEDDIAGVRALYPGPERAANLSVGEETCAGGRVDVTFRWSPSREADGYFMDITLDSSFGAFFGLYAGAAGTPGIRLPSLAAGLPHYWRLWNFSGAGGGHGYGPGFVTPHCFGAAIVPAGPAGLITTMACEGRSVVAALNWMRSLGASGYFVDLTLDPGFGGFLNNQTNVNGLFWAGLLPNTTHYFRVYAYNSNGGFHSYTESFRTPAC